MRTYLLFAYCFFTSAETRNFQPIQPCKKIAPYISTRIVKTIACPQEQVIKQLKKFIEKKLSQRSFSNEDYKYPSLLFEEALTAEGMKKFEAFLHAHDCTIKDILLWYMCNFKVEPILIAAEQYWLSKGKKITLYDQDYWE